MKRGRRTAGTSAKRAATALGGVYSAPPPTPPPAADVETCMQLADESIAAIIKRAESSGRLSRPICMRGDQDAVREREAFVHGEKDLTPEQSLALLAVARGQNVAIMGPAGTGKTHLIRVIQRMCAARALGMSVMLTASTGVAAASIDGTTLNSALGFGSSTIGDPASVARAMMEKNRIRCHNLRSTKTLVIDEVSMIRSSFAKAASSVLQRIRGNDKPFGGMQLVVLGDPLQLSPIEPDHEQSDAAPWWHEMGCVQVLLRRSMRQRGEDAFVRILDRIRTGRFSDEIVSRECSKRVESRVRAEERAAFADSLHLFATNDDVRRFNDARIQQLHRAVVHYEPRVRLMPKDAGGAVNSSGPFQVVTPAATQTPFGRRAMDRGYTLHVSQKVVQAGGLAAEHMAALTNVIHRILAENLYAEKTGMCVGARVICVRNISVDHGLVNGARGVVVGWHHRSSAPARSARSSPAHDASRPQSPRPASASAAASAAAPASAVMSASDWLAAPDGRSASTSLVCSIASPLSSERERRVFYMSHDGMPGREEWGDCFEWLPVVRMEATGYHFAFQECRAIKEFVLGVVEVAYIPLALAHALTVHKAQGMTVPSVVIHNDDMRKPGQLYVAMSRAPSISSILLKNEWTPENYSSSETACRWERSESMVSLPDCDS